MVKKGKGARKQPKVWGKAEVRSVSAADPEAFRRMLGPGALDQSVRHALQLCWMLLPNETKSADEAERVFREIVDRAIKDMREDQARFLPPLPGSGPA